MNILYLYILILIIILPLTNAFELTWSSTSHIYGTLPSPRAYQQISVSSSNDIYLFGGRYQSNGIIDYFKTDIWKWNQQNSNWGTLTQIDTNLISFNGCNIPDINKTDCGFFGINKTQCEERNCCWQQIMPNPNNYPYCYYYNGDQLGDEQPSFWSFTRTNAIINNLVYFIGIDYNGPHNSISDGRIFVFDMNTDKFISHSISPMPIISMYGCTANYNDEIIFYVGGDTYPSPIKPSLLALNVSSQQWISKTVPPVAYYTQSCEIVNDKLYQFGGWNDYSAQDKIFKYDISSDYWTPSSIDSLSQVRDTLRSILTYDKRFVYIVGGWVAAGVASHVIDVFDVNLEAIVDSHQLPSEGATASLALINKKILYFGGYYHIGQNRQSSDIILISNIITPTPTTYPTSDPTVDPTADPTRDPTIDPTTNPTTDPTLDPTTLDPTNDPTTSNPTIYPTKHPSKHPTLNPSSSPTNIPTKSPTYSDGQQKDETTTEYLENTDLNSNNTTKKDDNLIFIVIGISVLMLILILMFSFCIYKRKKTNEADHSISNMAIELHETKRENGIGTQRIGSISTFGEDMDDESNENNTNDDDDENKMMTLHSKDIDGENDVSDSEKLYEDKTCLTLGNDHIIDQSITPGDDDHITPGINNQEQQHAVNSNINYTDNNGEDNDDIYTSAANSKTTGGNDED